MATRATITTTSTRRNATNESHKPILASTRRLRTETWPPCSDPNYTLPPTRHKGGRIYPGWVCDLSSCTCNGVWLLAMGSSPETHHETRSSDEVQTYNLSTSVATPPAIQDRFGVSPHLRHTLKIERCLAGFRQVYASPDTEVEVLVYLLERSVQAQSPSSRKSLTWVTCLWRLWRENCRQGEARLKGTESTAWTSMSRDCSAFDTQSPILHLPPFCSNSCTSGFLW